MNLNQTRQFAHQIAHQLQQNNGGVVLLSGPMGAGKTTLVSEIVHVLCPAVVANSPTYTIINQYAENIFHADLYRLVENDRENAVCDDAKINQVMESIGLLDLCVNGNYVFIEWPNGLNLPHAIQIKIKIKENGDREFIIA
ncbi:MAG: tRNA (adenosine(37)-N6)-threonylcarbamoyltransferase complex ATPase subunit type 1 TsaE [Clostridia bacterium]|nr:tRNA (adenosine(37)-N6)-threonylcarbamoyltransferase complex ATPase subunit type 1 TsaE [Clostridia bacterium]